VGHIDTGRRVNGMGTGVVIDHRGYIITNHHVVDGVREILVSTDSGKELTARLIAHDPETDLAIIKIEADEPLPVITAGTSADLMPGEPVVAVGNAYGYEHTATRGIISALHRPVRVSDAQFYDDLIQTDASINPGNSGGPLLNIDGEMIGINVAVRAGAQGIGFAIPVDRALDVAAKLLALAKSAEAWHGIELADDASDRDAAMVATVDTDSPAAQAGLEPGDLITAVDEQTVTRAIDFHRAVLGTAIGQEFEVSVRRGDETVQLQLTMAQTPGHLKPVNSPAWEVFGLKLKPIPGEEFRRRFRTRYRGGLEVAAVRPDSPAASTGIRQGDVLVGMHVWETISMENVSYIIDLPEFSTLNPIKFFILRGNEMFYGFLPTTTERTARR
jgi:serine protease Do